MAGSDRVGGEDRYATAALIARELASGLTASGGAPGGVLLASGEDASGGIDALAASSLAGHLSAPVVLTQRSSLPAVIAAAADMRRTASASRSSAPARRNSARSDPEPSASGGI